MSKILKLDPSSPRKEYLVQGLPLATRRQQDNENILDDDWKFIDTGDSLVAIFPTADGEDFEEVEIDLTQNGLQLSDKLFERVGFTRDYVSKVLEARLEDEDDLEDDDEYSAESVRSLTL